MIEQLYVIQDHQRLYDPMVKLPADNEGSLENDYIIWAGIFYIQLTIGRAFGR